MSSNIEIQRICEHCNQPFTARTFVTRFCSPDCGKKAYKERKRNERKSFNMVSLPYKKMLEIERLSDQYEILKNKEYLSVSETADLLSVGRTTIYRYLYNGDLTAVQMGGKTFIRKADIDIKFDNSIQYKARPEKEKKPITDFYTSSEIRELYRIKDSWLYKIVRENNIPKTLVRGKSYYSKQHIDNYFRKKGLVRDQSITEWYTVDDICKKFMMTLAAVYCFVSVNNIPRKKDGRTVYYSKKHFDIAKKIAVPEEPPYYSVVEAMAKYKITRDALYSYVKSHKIPKVKEGKYIKISKPELDKLFEIPKLMQ